MSKKVSKNSRSATCPKAAPKAIASISSRDIPKTKEHIEERECRKGRKMSDTLASSIGSKTFAQLTPSEKDTLLEVIALRLGLVKPSI